MYLMKALVTEEAPVAGRGLGGAPEPAHPPVGGALSLTRGEGEEKVMGHTYAELRRMSVDELIQAYDRQAQYVELYAELCRREIALREMEEHSQRMLTMTAEMRQWTGRVGWLTVAIAGLTLVNTLFVALTDFYRP
jgi:hypothetical protein